MPAKRFKTPWATALGDTLRLARVSGEQVLPGHSPGPKLPPGLVRLYRAVCLARSRGSNERLRRAAGRFEQGALDWLGPAAPVRAMPLPTWDYASQGPQDFQRQHVLARRPAVLRGFDAEVFGSWSTAGLMDEFAQTPVALTCSRTSRAEQHPLGELGQASPMGGRWYAENLGSILYQDPGRLQALELDRLVPFLDPAGHSKDRSQMFLGLHLGPGTPLHCNSEFNVFFQIEGRKRWILIDPLWTPLLYPLFSRNTIYQLSCIGDPWAEDALERFPLLAHVPRYTVTLEPGDVLLNMPGWWHAVQLESEPNLSVANRWHCPPEATGAGPVLSYIWKNLAPKPNPGAHDNHIRQHVGQNLWRS